MYTYIPYSADQVGSTTLSTRVRVRVRAGQGRGRPHLYPGTGTADGWRREDQVRVTDLAVYLYFVCMYVCMYACMHALFDIRSAIFVRCMYVMICMYVT